MAQMRFEIIPSLPILIGIYLQQKKLSLLLSLELWEKVILAI